MGVGDIVRQIEGVRAKSEQEKKAIPPQWADGARKQREQEIDVAAGEKLGELRAAALEMAAEERADILTQFYRRRAAASPVGVEWEEATARRSWVRDELAGLDADQVLAMYRAFRLAKDRVGQFLVAVEGEQRLQALEKTIGLPATKALAALRSAHWGEVEAAQKKSTAELDELMVRMTRALAGPQERPKIAF